MSAGPNAKPLGKDPNEPPVPVECSGCPWEGDVSELLAEPGDETLWCPCCGGATWVFR